MRTVLTDREVEALLAAPEKKRYEYFIKQAADWEEIWSLRNADGWVLLGDEERHQLVPIWPHARYAEVCAVNDWADCSPAAISLSDWLTKWIPGMTREGRLVAVFPTPAGRAVVVIPDELRMHLEAELECYE